MTYGNVNVDTVTTSTPNGILGAGNASIMKNRIINGAMVIDQRNAGASVTQNNSGTQYCLDRWNIYGDVSSKFTVQQNAGSVTPPSGFANYMGFTSASAYSVPSTESYFFQQLVEGFNAFDLGWGTAQAKTVCLSFWVRSSLTGSFGGVVNNGAFDYSYPFSYTISSANTWQQISVTIAGPTAGTWIGATNGNFMRVEWSLGSGASVSGTAGAWTASGLRSATGATSVVGTSGATFYITGVQLEVGSSATGFEYRLYNQELLACQRYFGKYLAGDANSGFGTGLFTTTTTGRCCFMFPTTMRTSPTIAQSSLALNDTQASLSVTAIGYTAVNINGVMIDFTVSGATQFRGFIATFATTSGYITMSSEL